MAIAFVTAGNSGGGSFSLTSSGSDRYLIVYSSQNITAITYNGVSLTNIKTYTPSFPSGTNCPPLKLWGLANPDTGANTLAPSGTGFVVAAIYSGVAPGGIEATYDEDSANNQVTTWTGTVTTLSPNAWTVMGVRCNNTTNDFNAGASTTKRASNTGVSDPSLAIFDSNAAISTPSSSSLNSSLTSSSGFMTSITISLQPVFESKGSFLQYF